jgi:alpha-D-ribose 1-methylphosphonate 5-triphosphate synthase subunit PhnI
MPTEYDATEFVDTDFQPSKPPYPASAPGVATVNSYRAPTREEVDSRVSEAQRKLAELKRAQEELERERAALEEVRRRQTEFQTGRQEMIQNLTRGLGLLEEAEFTARREAEQMAKTIAEMRDALAKVQVINEESWSKEQFNVELTRALTTLEHARLEWNSARLKFGVLSSEGDKAATAAASAPNSGRPQWAPQSFWELCKLGLAFTWPLALVALLGLGVLVAILLRSH